MAEKARWLSECEKPMRLSQFRIKAHFFKNYWKQSHLLHDGVLFWLLQHKWTRPVFVSSFLDPNTVLSLHGRAIRWIKTSKVHKCTELSAQDSTNNRKKRVGSFICKPVTSGSVFVCCTFTWQHNHFKITIFSPPHLRSGKVSGATLVQQYRGFICIYTINHFVPKVRWNDLEKTNPERGGTRKRGRSVADEDREKALVML